MCGIAGIHLKDPGFVKQHAGLENFSNALLLGIESRGRRATGFVAAQEKGRGTVIEKSDMCASDFIKVRRDLPRGARTVLLHTRLDTKGDPKNNDNNHPVVCKSTFATHNGAIYNDDELFENYALERKAQVDSEVIPALLNKIGLDKPEDALTAFQGSMAIAAFDPIRYPDQLLLAKGEYSPLVVVENDDFIVWASEKKAIEDAWALVLGTPPKWKRYQFFKAGEYWLINQDQTVTKGEFDVLNGWEERNRRRAQRNGGGGRTVGVQVTHRNTHAGWGTSWEDSGWGSDADYGSRTIQYPRHRNEDQWTTRTDLREHVEVLRKAGRGQCCVMGQAAPADVHAAARGTVVWVRCTGCKEKVLKDQIHTSLSWGRMCLDCYEVAIKIAQAKNDPKNLLTTDEKRQINNWTKVESMIHRKALGKIAKEIELPEETIEWLVFRAPTTFTTKHKNANDLAAELDDRYQIVTARLFEEHGIDDATDTAQTVERGTTEVTPRIDPFVNCASHHEVFRSSQGCSQCAKAFKEQEVSVFLLPMPERTNCITCKANGRIQRGKMRLGGLIFCNKHWKECHNGDGLKAVATDEEGTRHCHYCSRGQKGLLFDGNAKNFGAEIAEVQ